MGSLLFRRQWQRWSGLRGGVLQTTCARQRDLSSTEGESKRKNVKKIRKAIWEEKWRTLSEPHITGEERRERGDRDRRDREEDRGGDRVRGDRGGDKVIRDRGGGGAEESEEWEGSPSESLASNDFQRMQAGVVQWFPGHMYSASQKMHSLLIDKSVDLVVEVRDARIPFTSTNHILEGLIKGKQRVIALNKAELADKHSQQHVSVAVKKETGAEAVLFTNARQDSSVEALLQQCLARIKRNQSRVDANKMMVVGMPNVGKSTLINAFKKTIGKVARDHREAIDVGLSSSSSSSSVQRLREWAKKSGTSAQNLPFTLMDNNKDSDTRVKKKKKKQDLVKTGPLPGVTRDVHSFWVSRNPALLCVDSPGMLLPRMSDAEKMLKLASVGCIKDDLAGEFLIADYLLFQLKQKSAGHVAKVYNLSVDSLEPMDVAALLAHIAQERHFRGDDSSVTLHAARQFIRDFRDGSLGRISLDDIPEQ